MEDMVKQYGSGLLQILGGLGIFVVFGRILWNGGILSGIIVRYMTGICG